MLSELASVITIFEFISKILKQTEPNSSRAIDTVLSSGNTNFDSKKIIQELLIFNKGNSKFLPENKVAEIVVYNDILKRTANAIENYTTRDLGKVLNTLIHNVRNKFFYYYCFQDFDHNFYKGNSSNGYLIFKNLENAFFQYNLMPMNRRSKYDLHLSSSERTKLEYSNLNDVYNEFHSSNNYKYCRISFLSGFCSVEYNDNSIFTRRSFSLTKNEKSIININEFEIYFNAIMLDAIYYLNKSINKNHRSLDILNKYR